MGRQRREGWRKEKGNRIFNRGRKECLLSVAAAAPVANWYSIWVTASPVPIFFCMPATYRVVSHFLPFAFHWLHNFAFPLFTDLQTKPKTLRFFPHPYFSFFVYLCTEEEIFWIQNFYNQHISWLFEVYTCIY